MLEHRYGWVNTGHHQCVVLAEPLRARFQIRKSSVNLRGIAEPPVFMQRFNWRAGGLRGVAGLRWLYATGPWLWSNEQHYSIFISKYPVMSSKGSFSVASNSGHRPQGQAHSRLSERDSRPPVSSKTTNNNIVVSTPRSWLKSLGPQETPAVVMFATVCNTHIPQFMSLILEPLALAIHALSQDWQGRAMYMFPPFPLLNKVVQKLWATQDSEIFLIAPWWPSQPWFPHLLRLCVDHPRIIPYHLDRLSSRTIW